jgi:hypothetical protein
MTFDQLYKSLLEAVPGITAPVVPVVPKTGLSALGGNQLINAPKTSLKSQYTGTEAPTDDPQDPQQPNTGDQQSKQIQDLQTMVNSLTTTLAELQKAQGLPPGPKKPTFTSAPVAPPPQVK